MTKFNHIGSVSSGTMRIEDLIPCFVDLLDKLKEDLSMSVPSGASAADQQAVVQQVKAIDDLLASIERHMGAPDYFDVEIADDDLNDLFDQLSAFAPPYFYFGGHPGDCADYGFWLNQDALDDAVANDDVLIVDDLAEANNYKGMILVVSDHGNQTLYDNTQGDGSTPVEIWSIV